MNKNSQAFLCNNHLQNMKHLAAYLLLVLGGNESPSADDVTKALSAVGIETDSEALDRLLADMEGKDIDSLIASGSKLMASFGGGGGGGAVTAAAASSGGAAAGAAAPKEEEKKEEEEEMDLGGGMDMFGGSGGGGGGGGDY
jgi:large subunit ribosomal protein LP2